MSVFPLFITPIAEWIQHYATDSISVQLLGREDLTIDDAETLQEKWRQYIESYVLVRPGSRVEVSLTIVQTHPTEGLPHRVDQPFLNRYV